MRTININLDEKVCVQCGKKGTGFYECTNDKGKYICQQCVLKNIERKKYPIRGTK